LIVLQANRISLQGLKVPRLVFELPGPRRATANSATFEQSNSSHYRHHSQHRQQKRQPDPLVAELGLSHQ
jgi:hypothetical protein